MFVKHYAATSKSEKAIFSTKVINFGDIRKGIISGVYMLKISNSSEVIAKVDNRRTNRWLEEQAGGQTDRQTDRQGKNNMPPIYLFRGIKITINLFYIYNILIIM